MIVLLLLTILLCFLPQFEPDFRKAYFLPFLFHLHETLCYSNIPCPSRFSEFLCNVSVRRKHQEENLGFRYIGYLQRVLTFLSSKNFRFSFSSFLNFGSIFSSN